MSKPWLYLLILGFLLIGAAPAAYAVYLITSVLFLGGGSSCPQNLCP